MTISWGNFTKPDGSSYKQIVVSQTSDWNFFDEAAQLIESDFSGHWSDKADGLDQRYWDYDSDGAKITLHLEHYLGITVFPTDGAAADPKSLRLMEKLHRAFSRKYA